MSGYILFISMIIMTQTLFKDLNPNGMYSSSVLFHTIPPFHKRARKLPHLYRNYDQLGGAYLSIFTQERVISPNVWQVHSQISNKLGLNMQ